MALSLPARNLQADTTFSFNEHGPFQWTVDGRELLLPGIKPAIVRLRIGDQERPVQRRTTQAVYDVTAQTALIESGDYAVDIHYALKDGDLIITGKIINNGEEPIQDVVVRLLGIRLPQLPGGWPWSRGGGPTRLGVEEPRIVLANGTDFSLGVIRQSGTRPFRFGFGSALDREHKRYPFFPVEISTRISDHPDWIVKIEPGESFDFEIALRYRPERVGIEVIAPELVAEFREEFPFVMQWDDRRPIARVFLSSSADEARTASNPRGWLNDGSIDVFTEEGQQEFRRRMHAYIDQVVENCKKNDAQGVLIWDFEGFEFLPATFVGDPRELKQLAPEMERFADEFLKKFSDAGIRIGMTIRPSIIRYRTDDDGVVTPIHGNMGFDIIQNMADKIKYAKDRWGAEIFYVDTNIQWYFSAVNGKPTSRVIPAKDMIRLAQMHPDVLIFPEFGSAAYYSALAVYGELRGGRASTSSEVRTLYPDAASVIVPSEGDVTGRWNQMVQGVKAGDILTIDGWWEPTHNKQVREIYADSKLENPPSRQPSKVDLLMDEILKETMSLDL